MRSQVFVGCFQTLANGGAQLFKRSVKLGWTLRDEYQLAEDVVESEVDRLGGRSDYVILGVFLQ
jgi:hypothetical protein